MNLKTTKTATLGAALLAALTIGGGAAYASTSASATTSAPRPAAPSVSSTQSSAQDITRPDPGDGTDPEKAGSESAAGVEINVPEVDGPGGHADANGANVDHQFNGNE